MIDISDFHKKELHGYSYFYLIGHFDSCYCMWVADSENDMVFTVGRIDVLPSMRRKGLGRKLLQGALEHIKKEHPKACIEIIAQADSDEQVSTKDLVKFYKSVGFELHQDYGSKVHLRLYFDSELKPQPLFDSPFYFRDYAF